MKKLISGSFLKFLSGFLLILFLSISFLLFTGLYEDLEKQVAAILESL